MLREIRTRSEARSSAKSSAVARRSVAAAGLGVFIAAAIAIPASAEYNDSGSFEGFAPGEPVGQFGWTAQDIGGYNSANFDIDVVDMTSAPWDASPWGTQLGSRALRMSNSVTSLAFGNQLQSFSLTDEAGETAAADSPNSGGDRQTRMSGSLTFGSATQSYQPGLAITISPDEGAGTRMAFFRISDQPGGLRVSVSYTSPDPGNVPHSTFTEEVLAENLDRTLLHTLEFTIDFLDGENNDILWARVGTDGCENWTESGTWETYHVLDGGGGLPHPVDSLLFRISTDPGAGGPALMGQGLLFDNVAIETSTVPPTIPVGTPGRPAAPEVMISGTTVSVTGTTVPVNPCAPVTEYRATLIPLHGGTPVTFTSPTPNFSFPLPEEGNWDVTLALTNSQGTSEESDPAALTVLLAASGPNEFTAPLSAVAVALTGLGALLIVMGRARRRTVAN